MASKKQSEFATLTDPTGMYLSGHLGALNYKISSSVFSLQTHAHNSDDINNASDVAGATVSDSLDVLSAAIAAASVGTVPVSGITNVAANKLIGNPTGSQAAAAEIPLDATLAFTTGSLGVAATTTPAADAIPKGGVGGTLAAWIPDASDTVKGLLQYGGDIAATSTPTSQVVSKATFNGVQYTLGALTDTQILTVSGTTITSSAAPTAATITSQATAEAGVNNTEIMSPLRTKQAVTAYGVLADYPSYTNKSPVVGADTVLVADSAASFALKEVLVSDLVAGASGLAAATQAQMLALTSNTVGVTPLRVADLNADRRMFSETAGAVSTADVTINRSITVLDTGVNRVFLPASDEHIPTSVLYNDTPNIVNVYPYEGRIATGAYFNGVTGIIMARTGANSLSNGLELLTNVMMTGHIEFTSDALPTTSQWLFGTESLAANDFRGFACYLSSIAGKPIIFQGWPGGSQVATFQVQSTASAWSAGTFTDLAFSWDFSGAGVFHGAINGVIDAFNGTTPVFPTVAHQIALPAVSNPLRVGVRSYSGSTASGGPHIGNIYRLVLWPGVYTDLTVAGNLAAIRATAAPVNLGKTGWRPRGSFANPAALYMNAGADNFRVNQAPNFDNATNTVGTLLGSNVVPTPAGNATLQPVTIARAGLLAAHNIKGRTAPFPLPAGARASYTLIEGANTYVMGGGA